MIYLLEPMLNATKILFKSSYPTISNIHLTFIDIIQRINLFITNKSHSKEKNAMASSIDQMLKKYWAILNCNELTKIATILDLTSKLMMFLLFNKRDITIASLQNVIAQYELLVLVTSASSTLSFNEKRKKFIALISQQTSKLPTIRLSVSEELQTYLFLLTIESNSLEWWANNKNRFPVLAKIAQDYLTIQGTSVPCKEVFSTALITISKLHNHLKPKTT
ncbi:3770_t:CDS:1, partial [Cetraspora pellucida]